MGQALEEGEERGGVRVGEGDTSSGIVRRWGATGRISFAQTRRPVTFAVLTLKLDLEHGEFVRVQREQTESLLATRVLGSSQQRSATPFTSDAPSHSLEYPEDFSSLLGTTQVAPLAAARLVVSTRASPPRQPCPAPSAFHRRDTSSSAA